MSTPPGEDRPTADDQTGTGPDSFDEALGRIIKVVRTDLGLERGDLADRAGISYSYLAAIENGQRRPSSTVLRSIAEALGVRSHMLVESAEARMERPLQQAFHHRPPSPAFMKPRPMSPQLRHQAMFDDLFDLIESLTPEDRELVRTFVLRLLGR